MKKEEQEINNTIAKYMGAVSPVECHNGWIWQHDETTPKDSPQRGLFKGSFYTDSLDTLIPVIDKLIEDQVILEGSIMFDHSGYLVDVHDYDDLKLDCRASDKSPSLALSTTLAKTIKELNN